MSDKLKASIEVKCTELQPGQLKAEYTVSRTAIGEAAQEVAAEFVSFAAVPGFRKGKAPLRMVMKKYEPNIKEELTRRVLQAAMGKFSEERSAEVLAFNLPSGVKLPELRLDGDFNFVMELDVAPEIKLPDFKSLKYDVEEGTVSAADIDAQIENYKENYASFQEVDGPAETMDMLKVSYTSDIELAEGASPMATRLVEAEDGWIWLNDSENIPGATVALTGAMKGQTYKFKAEFPADHKEAELAGKSGNYTVTVNAIQRRVPLADIQALCERLRVESEAELRERIEVSLKMDAAMKVMEQKRAKAMDSLVSAAGELVLPPSLLAQEQQKELSRIAHSTIKNEEDAEEFKKALEQHRKDAVASARAKLTRMLIVRKIAGAEKITLNEDELDNHIKGMGRYYGMKANELRGRLEKNGGLEDIEFELLSNKVIDFVVSESAK